MFDPPDSLGLEAAFQEIRRMDNRLAENFLAALRGEEARGIDTLLLAPPEAIREAQGAASMCRSLRVRLENAEDRMKDAAAHAGRHLKGHAL